MHALSLLSSSTRSAAESSNNDNAFSATATQLDLGRLTRLTASNSLRC
jgi:hypothetical protein